MLIRAVQQGGEFAPCDAKSGENARHDFHCGISLPALDIAQIIGCDASSMGCLFDGVAAVVAETSENDAERRV